MHIDTMIHARSGRSGRSAVLMTGKWMGDLLTPKGIPAPVVWLADPRRRVAIGLFTTGHSLERFVVGPLFGLAVLVICWWRADMHNPAQLMNLLYDWLGGRPR